MFERGEAFPNIACHLFGNGMFTSSRPGIYVNFFGDSPGASFQFKAEKFRKDPAVVLAAVQRKPEAERNVGPLSDMSMGQYL